MSDQKRSSLLASPQPALKLSKSERTRAAILNGALDFIWSHPFREMTVSSLMAETGVSRSAFYQYFENRHELMETLLEKLQDEHFDVTSPWTAGIGDPVALLRQKLDIPRGGTQPVIMRTAVLTILAACLALPLPTPAGAEEPAKASPTVATPTPTFAKPRLVLQITVDQFRGDLPTRYADRLGEGGLRYLLEEGIHYDNAHHAHANTETIVGHVTLATGAHPAAHGMIGNIWFDRTTGATTYNIEDPDHRLLTEGADVDAETEIDPTQKAATSDGRSPMAILTTTFSDELASLTAGNAKIFGVSVKDRGAVSMAGHTGKAFWFSKATNQFVTSSYYYDEYPQWIVDWNAKKLPESYANTAWELLHPIDTYLFGDRDDQEWEFALGSYGRTFPHEFTTPENPYFSTYLTISPAGDQMTTDFAKTVIAEEGLGDDEITDYLGVSYSATDYVGHFFGPSSLESEDNILQLDRTLADLFAYVEQEIGLANTLIVLSADHGAPEAPGYLESIGIPAGYVSPDEWDTDPVVARIKSKFGIEGRMIEGYDHPYLYLTNDVLNDPDIDLAALETMIAEELVAFPAVSYAVPSTSLGRGTVPDNQLTRAVLNNYNAARSGNIYVVFNPGWFINDLDGLSVAVVHGSPWRYDTYVPILFAGNGIKPQKVSRRVHTIDVAITLATAVGTRPPSGAAGEVLLEVLGQEP